MADKSWELLTKLISACGYGVAEIEDEFDFDELCDDIKNRLARKMQECEQKEKELKELKRQYKLSCLDCEYKNTKTDADRYRKALEEIERVFECGIEYGSGLHNQVLDIINKAKGE